MTETRVSAPQFFSLLYLSVLSSIFMYVSSPAITVSESDSLLRPLVFAALTVVCGIPMFFLRSRIEKRDDLKKLSEKSRFLKVAAGIYAFVYSAEIVRTAARFDLFASSELFPGTEMTVFIIALIAVCALLSGLGLGALSRAGVIFTVIVVGATGFVMVSLSKEIDILNFTPLFRDGALSFFGDSLLFAVQATEIGAIAPVLPEIKGKVIKNYVLWAALSGVTFIAVLFFVVGTLGAFADTQLFPTYTAVTLAEFGLLERIDALETAVWILCVVEKISFCFFVVVKSIKIIIPKSPRGTVSAVLTAVIGAVLWFISGNLERFSFISYTPVVVGMYVVPVIVLPIAVNVYLKRVKIYEKNSDVD